MDVTHELGMCVRLIHFTVTLALKILDAAEGRLDLRQQSTDGPGSSP